MMDAIAGAAMDMSAAQTSLAYSLAVTKKMMDTQEVVAQELLGDAASAATDGRIH